MVLVDQRQYHQIYQGQFLLGSTGSIINSSIIRKPEHNKNQGMAPQINSINTEGWHRALPPTSNIRMDQESVILLQGTINQALQQIIEVFHLGLECPAPILLLTIK